MAMTIRTSDGDRLDTLCYRYYGHLHGCLEAVLAANPGLAGVVQPYSSGVLIEMPDLPPPVRESVTLWE